MKKNCYQINYNLFIIQNQIVILEINSKYCTCQIFQLKKLQPATGIGTSHLAAKKGLFIALEAEIDKLDANNLSNVPTSLNNLETKVDKLDVSKLKPASEDLKKLNDVVDNEVVKYTKFNTLKTKVNSIDKKNHDGTSLIHINQYNIDKQNLEKKG